MSRFLIRIFVRVHTALYRLSKGVIGERLNIAHILLLTTIGRKSGQERVTPLRFLRHGDAYLIAGSNNGEPTHPAWFFNIQANPRVTIQIKERIMPAIAEIATGAENEALYQKFIDEDQRFAQYRARAGGRTIPVVVLRVQV